jgi:hypothetical protein
MKTANSFLHGIRSTKSFAKSVKLKLFLDESTRERMNVEEL